MVSATLGGGPCSKSYSRAPHGLLPSDFVEYIPATPHSAWELHSRWPRVPPAVTLLLTAIAVKANSRPGPGDAQWRSLLGCSGEQVEEVACSLTMLRFRTSGKCKVTLGELEEDRTQLLLLAQSPGKHTLRQPLSENGHS